MLTYEVKDVEGILSGQEFGHGRLCLVIRAHGDESGTLQLAPVVQVSTSA